MKKNMNQVDSAYSPEQIKEAFDGLEYIKKAVQQNNITPFIIAKAALKAKKEKYFEKNGLTQKDFLGDISLNEKTLSKYEVIYKAFVIVGGYSMVSLSGRNDILNRLDKLRLKLFKTKRGKLPILKVDKDVLDEWVSRAIELPTTDFWTCFNEEFVHDNKIDDGHEHLWEKKEKYVCKECGDTTFSTPEEHEHVEGK